MRLLTGLLLVAIASASWAGDIYRWVDEKGVIRYSDLMPPPGAKNVQKFKSSGASLTAEKPPAALPPQSQAAAEKLPVTLYSFDECAPCKSAEEFLNSRGVPYQLKSTNDDLIALHKLTGKPDVPVMVIGNTEPIIGFEEGRWNKELDLAGYAKSNPGAKLGTSMAIKPVPRETGAKE